MSTRAAGSPPEHDPSLFAVKGRLILDGGLTPGAVIVRDGHILEVLRGPSPADLPATVHEAATATQGTRRRRGSRPVSKKARAARNPQRAPAVPTRVKARITAVSGVHFRPKSTRNSARSRSLTLRVRPFKFLP